MPLPTTSFQKNPIIVSDLLGLTTTPDPSDECALNTHNCHEHASCTDTPTSFECKCLDGFIGNGTSCTGKIPCMKVILDPKYF